MKYIKLFFIFCLSILTFQSKAQQGRLNQVSSNYTRIVDQNKWIALTGVYEQNGNILRADSSILFEDDIKRQFFDAFNNVVITQPSGTIIYANKLNYNAQTQIAVLTGNVRLVSENSTLTTNHLTYNLSSKTGTYTGGGRIISQADTITSQRAYYFETRGDAFFRGKVIVRTPQVKVFTDSMNYNQITKDTYFYGPTDIKGNNKENLYTERGLYNTATGVAKFSKNNLYNEGSKFLSGDSLYYNRDNGVGEAFRNVVFVDTTDKFHAYGNKGLYKQSDESILMTDKPYIVTLIKNDSTKSDSNQSTVDSIPDKNNSKKKSKQEEQLITIGNVDKVTITPTDSTNSDFGLKTIKDNSVDSVYMTADTLYSRVILAKDYKPLDLQLNRDGGAIMVQDEIDYGDDDDDDDEIRITSPSDSISINNKGDEIVINELKKVLSNSIDTTKVQNKKAIPTIKKEEAMSITQTLKADSILRKNAIIPVINQRDSILNKALKTAQSPDTIKVNNDSLIQNSHADTARTRIVKAYYNVRLFKSDLQAVADSVYYGMQDSMFRFMGRPMIWSQGTQISADTIYMQIVNQKMDNALLKENAFMVNVVLDSLKFNQMKGRKITAFFKNNSIERLYVDGNAENLVFSADEKTKIITEMFHDRGGRIKVKMDNNEIIDYTTIQKVDQKVFPFAMVNQENEILPGFIWRPQDRPLSKEDLLNRKREIPKEAEPKEDKIKSDSKSKEIEDLDM